MTTKPNVIEEKVAAGKAKESNAAIEREAGKVGSRKPGVKEEDWVKPMIYEFDTFLYCMGEG